MWNKNPEDTELKCDEKCVNKLIVLCLSGQ